ncbi:hypothetical protein [Kineosporia sp. R_H_3]|uniref:hypothetical protein n=1 Tax=Kineosporia sp. R_H_3 TaxID=1961848 RepID=UPI000B4C19C3|nr:hypothetical protein [Kineosporia sp. R_H_3]
MTDATTSVPTATKHPTVNPADGLSTSGPALPAVVCDMTDAPDTGQERLREYARLFDAAFISREHTEVGMRWRLRADDGIEAWARDLAARENACCAFMTNTVTVVADQVLWEATTIDDDSARAVLDLFYELPEQRWTDVEQVHDRFVAATGVPIVITEGQVTRPAELREIRSGRAHAPLSGQG